MSIAMDSERSEERLRIALHLPAPIARVWAALTSPTALAQWWGDYVSLEPRPGGRFRETWNNGAGRELVTSGVVTRFEPPGRLVLSWQDDDWPGETEVEFTLDDDAAGRTRLTLEHRGWAALKVPDTPRLIANHAAGWQHHLASLHRYLEG